MIVPINLSAAEQVITNSLMAMDPRLQFILARRRAGIARRPTASTDADEIGVIARTSDVQQWCERTDVRDPVVVGAVQPTGSPSSTNPIETIVTGRIPIQRIEAIRRLPFIKSLKAAVPFRPMLAATTQETNSQPTQLPIGHHTSGGKGVVVGIVDYGCDFAHQNFRKTNGSTRVVSLWDQNGGNSPSSPFGYGREHDAASLNAALKKPNPYTAAGYDPEEFSDGSGSHGTHIMDIAAGNGRGSSTPGMAPESDIIFVNITHDKDPTGASVVGNSFGDSVSLLEALKYIFDKAGSKACVVNASVGTNGGPHDGTTLVEQGIDALVSAAPNRAVVFAASNSFEDGIHAAGKVSPGANVDLVWDVVSTLSSDIELEIWFKGVDRFQVELIAPSGVSLVTVEPGQTKQVNSNGKMVALVANRLNDPNNHDNLIGLFLAEGVPAGRYVVRLTGLSITDGHFHAWIERDNSFQSSFLPPHDNTHTIGSISCSKLLIAVGSYDAHVPGLPLSFFSSSGPTRDGRNKPEVSAPGHNVWAAKSGSRTKVTRKSGTSMAAPAVAGHVALIFEEAQAHGLQLSAQQTREIVIQASKQNPPQGSPWDRRYGFGRIDTAKAIALVASMAAPASETSSKAANKNKKRQ